MTVEEDFRALREHDAKRAPSFEAMRARPAPRPRSVVVVLIPATAATLAAAAALVLWLSTRAQAPHTTFNPTAVQVTAANPEPLAFLLDPALETDTLRGGP